MTITIKLLLLFSHKHTQTDIVIPSEMISFQNCSNTLVYNFLSFVFVSKQENQVRFH